MKARAALVFAAMCSMPAWGMDFCPSSAPIEIPIASPGKPVDACEAVRTLSKVTSACAAEYPDDRRLQQHAARILELERQRAIGLNVVAGLRKMQDPKVDPALMAKRIAMLEEGLARTEADLAASRKAAVSAGYAQLREDGHSQKIITNAVWRYLDGEARRYAAGCSSGEAGQRAAGEFVGLLGVSLSHGNPLEREIMRKLLP